MAPTQAKTLPSQSVLFEIARAVEDHPTPEAISALRAARQATRHAGVPKQLDRMLKRIEPALANRLEVAFRLPDGRVRQAVGEHTAVISTEGEVELSWWHGDKKLKAVPAAVRREHPEEVKRLRELAKQVRQQQATLVRALEAGYTSEDAPPYRRLAGQPLTERLIWEFEVSPGVWRSELGLGLPDMPVRLWHPARASLEEVVTWREVVQGKELRQPFKQAFREVYLLTPAEEATEIYSNRFAGHVVRLPKAVRAVQQRGWHADYLGPGMTVSPERRDACWPADDGGPSSTTSTSRTTRVTRVTDQVRFHRLARGRLAPGAADRGAAAGVQRGDARRGPVRRRSPRSRPTRMDRPRAGSAAGLLADRSFGALTAVRRGPPRRAVPADRPHDHRRPVHV